MERKFKVGDWVIYISKVWSNIWKSEGRPALYGKLAKIISINKTRYSPFSYTLEFKDWIDGHDGEGKGKAGHCHWGGKDEFKIMNREFKVGDEVIYIDKERSFWCKEQYGISLHKKVAKIIDIDTTDNDYLLEFKGFINVKGRDGYCKWCTKEDFKLKKGANNE